MLLAESFAQRFPPCELHGVHYANEMAFGPGISPSKSCSGIRDMFVKGGSPGRSQVIIAAERKAIRSACPTSRLVCRMHWVIRQVIITSRVTL